MKKLFTALLLLVGLVSFSQSTGYFRYDSVRFEKVGGNSEFILLNSTRDSIGVLYNMGNGRTRFRTISSLGITSTNIYNSDGTLTGNRVLNGNEYTLFFDSTSLTSFSTKVNSGRYSTLDIQSPGSVLRTFGNGGVATFETNATDPFSDGTKVGVLIRADNGLVDENRFALSERYIKLTTDSLKLPRYGTGTHTGTPTYTLQVDANGNVIEGSMTGGGSAIGDTINLLSAGQSNDGGYNFGDVDTLSNSKVQGWDPATNTWRTLRRNNFPMGSYTPGVKWSTGGFDADKDSATNFTFYFAKRLQERTGKFVRVVLLSYGGNTISNWIPAAATNFSSITTEIAAAGISKVHYFLWCQGESDNSMADTTYKNKFDTVVQQLDAQTWFGKEVPIFIVTVASSGVGGSPQMNHIQKAMTSGQYDPRYTLVDATLEPLISDNIHFTAQAHYNIANKMMQTLFNPSRLPNNWRQADSTERERQIQYAPNLNKGTVLRDTTTGYTYFLKPPFMLNGNNSVGAVLASTNNQVSRLQSYSVDDGSFNSPILRLRSVISGNINGEVVFMRGAATTSDGYVSIYTNTSGSQTEKVRFPNAGGITVQTGRVYVPQVSNNSSFEVDGFNVQSFGANNNFWTDNIVYNAGFKYRAAGPGFMGYFASGNLGFQSAPSGSAGAAATLSTKMLILNNGNTGIFGSASSSSLTALTGAPFAVIGDAVGIGTITPAASSSLDITSTTRGFLSPRMNTTQQNAISSPASGLLIYNTDSAKHCYYSGSAWVCYGASSGGGGGTPAGNQGNIQLKNGATFGTPGSDSLTFTSTGLNVKGTVTQSSLTSGRLILAGTSGVHQDDADLTFDGSKLSVGINSTGFSYVAGTTFGLQSFAVNNNFLSDNIVYNSGFKYVANGLGMINYFASGNWALQAAASGSAGGAATMATRAVVTNTGNFGFGGTLTSTGILTGATLFGNSTSVGILNTNPSAPLHIGTAGTSQGYIRMDGATSGTITIQGQAASGTYNYNLPTTAGSAGQFLTSQGGSTNAMTWTTGMSNPLTTTGDIITSSSGTTPARLGIGSTDQVLQVASGLPAWGPVVKAIDYTPTLTSVTNVSAPANDGNSHYYRIGNYITVWGTLELGATAGTTLSTIDVSLPVASALTALTDIKGTANVTGGSAINAGIIRADATNDRATIFFYSVGTGLHNVYYQFSYPVQ